MTRRRRVAGVAVVLAALLAWGGVAQTQARSGGPQFVWTGSQSSEGPILVVISLADQLAYVYRDGSRIATSRISSGRPGHETPPGVYTILDKDKEHFSNLYDSAPMPFMQRLTWSGLALHAGRLPGKPASHGCVRLPYKFAERLFEATQRGTTVVIVETMSLPGASSSRIFASNPMDSAPLSFTWRPEASPAGPITMVLSTSDGQIVVLRNGREIGRATVRLKGRFPRGPRVLWLLSGSRPELSPVVQNRLALRWLEISMDEGADDHEVAIVEALGDARVHVSQEFARFVYDTLQPGATLLITGAALRDVSTSSETGVLSASPSY